MANFRAEARYQLCLTPRDTLQLTQEGATGCLSWRLTLPLGISCCPQAALLLPCLGLSAGTATNSDIYVAALKASSLHFLLLPPLTPRWASAVPGHPAGSRLKPSPMLPACREDLTLPRSSPELPPCGPKTQARRQSLQALPDHDPGPLSPMPRLHPRPSGVQLGLGAPTPPVASHRRAYTSLCPRPAQLRASTH